jgi:transmembrane sensor
MNPSAEPFESAADEQAALWAARLDGSELTPGDRRALEAWLAEAPAHRELLSAYCRLSAELEAQIPARLGAAPAFAAGASGRPRARRWIAPLALAAAAGLVIGLWLGRPANSLTLAAPAGRRQAFTLGDGTRVELNARTRLEVELGRTERRVRLAQGEAFFSVSKDPSRPFTVATPAGSVRVTGTTFDVSSDTDSDLDVTVVEGRVLVRPGDPDGNGPTAPWVLGPGDRLSARGDRVSKQSLAGDDLADVLAWRQGRIVFHGASLRDALVPFARYHGLRIAVDEGAAGLSVGGTSSLDDLDGFLQGIGSMHGVRLRMETQPDGSVRVSVAGKP